jgi:L,D-transpeptidase ErfK/SrfK
MAGLHRSLVACMALAGALTLTACQGEASIDAADGPSIEDRRAQKESPRLDTLRARHAVLKRQLVQLAPSSPYIIVDTARNKLFVKRRGAVLLTALASTGSGTILDNPGRPGTQWVFDTPRGEFKIQSRLTNPVWVKPDWAFLEEGLGVPKYQEERIEAGILGPYALGFGKGYFIHGTLYTRMLGKNVTHGCIRLNDDDLKTVYRLAQIGTPLMIF